MSTYKLGNCEHLFKEKDYYINQLDSMKLHMNSIFSIVQNEGVTLTLEDLLAFESQIDFFIDDFRQFKKNFPKTVERIFDYIETCEVDTDAD